ncbi:hypothetical protein EJ04DRAFT_27710 [Polyplosphaeria fusca]|uniref:Homeobox domain-containing protein n=1 Tax=Polyplosphaeria fusca TaxID=682080 RepID=A0A9P4V5J8_9PLEO|nr:hypothetical protein EJ04DRAFT_27710 [Polyplosphaeria fusca]
MLSPAGLVPKTFAPSIWSFDSGYASSFLPEDEEKRDQLEAQASSSRHTALPFPLDENAGLGLAHLSNISIHDRLQLSNDEASIEPLVTKLNVFTTRDSYDNDLFLPKIPADGETCLACEFWKITNPDDNIRCEDCRPLPQLIEPSLLVAHSSKSKQPFPALSIPEGNASMSMTRSRCSACEMAAMMGPVSPRHCSTCSPTSSLLSPASPDPSEYRIRRSRAGRNSKLPPGALNRLQTWLDEHSDNPYPLPEEKRQLADQCGITEKQVTTWFVNARARQLTPLDTLLASASEDEAGDDSDMDMDSAVQSGTYANTGFTYLSENQPRNRRAGSVSGSSVLSGNKSQPSRRGKKKDYRRARQPPINELTTPDSAGSNMISPAQSLPTPTLASPNPTVEQEKTWQCTFCHRHLVPKSWRRHEETQHRPKANWTCMLYGPRISFPQRSTTSNGSSFCAFCMAKDPSEDHFLRNHRISECAKRPTGERTFLRPDHLRQHVKNFHSATLFDVVQARWKKAADMGEGAGAGWTCGFCGDRLDTWDKRETHIANHFKEGMTMDQWVEWPGLEITKKGSGRKGKDKSQGQSQGHHHRPSFERLRRSLTGHGRRSQPQPQPHAQPLATTFSNSFEPLPASVAMSDAHGYAHVSLSPPPPVLPDINLDPLMMDGFVDWQNVDFQFQDSSLYGAATSAPPTDFDAALDNVLGYGGNTVDFQGPWTTQG